MQPRELIEQLEAHPVLPSGTDERFNGYGVMGLPFRSGHILALRRFSATSIGPGYTSVWHRAPNGDWIFYTNVGASVSCPRYYGAAARDAVETPIDLEWLASDRLHVRIAVAPLEWDVTVAPTPATRLMNFMGSVLPGSAWRNSTVLSAMSLVAGPILRAGRVGLQGAAPNGQHFIANPKLIWAVVATRARVAGEDLGPAGPVEPQAHLGDFWIPQRGIFAIGEAFFDAFDPSRHSASFVHS